MENVLPFVAMLMLTCLDTAVLTIVKAAMNDGMSSFIYVVYHNALGTFILLPFFILHIIRKVDRPPLTLRILFRFFILGLLGVCLAQVLWNAGIDRASPTMANAISNLVPGITFLIRVFFRLEKIDTTSSSVAKLSGTMISILGAMVFTLYSGPRIFHANLPNQLILSQPSEWIFGSILILISVTFGCITGMQLIPLRSDVVFSLGAWGRKAQFSWSCFHPLSIFIAMIRGVTFLGDSLHLGSVIGTAIISFGFYTVIWGQMKEKNKLLVVTDEDLVISRSVGIEPFTKEQMI